jgi:3-oxoacyl-[acyl-carrier-protein] synthase II
MPGHHLMRPGAKIHHQPECHEDSMIGKRVVVTGLAAITPIGNDLATSWSNLLQGTSGIGPITQFDCSEFQTRIAGELKDFNPDGIIPPKQLKRMDRFAQIAVVAAHQLLKDGNFAISEEEAARCGVILGCGLGGLKTIEDFHSRLLKRGPNKISPFYIPELIANMSAGQVSIMSGAKGPNLTTTSACASALHGIGYAYSDIRLGRADVMITGGVESTITPIGVSGFNAMKALSTRNDEPEKASRPFDRDRDGFVIGEGCGLLLLESLDHALARGATIYAEVGGYGASSDAYHMTAPDQTGAGMAMAMKAAMADGEIRPEAVDHVNAHGTSTVLNDLSESRALKSVFGDHAGNISITANKSMIGHLLGAAGGAESVFTVMSIAESLIPKTINLDNPDDECDLNYVVGENRSQTIEHALCNSFGFGGTNASIIFKRYEK